MIRTLPLIGLLLLASPLEAAIQPAAEHHLADPQLGPAANTQSNARAASDGSGFLLTWTHSDLSSLGAIQAARIDAGGNLLDPKPLVIADKPYAAQVAFGGGRYLVTWSDDSSPHARFVDRTGAMSDVFALTQHRSSTPTRVAWNGRHFLVVWYEIEVSDLGQTNRVYTGALIDPNGTIVKADIPIASTNFSAAEFDLAAALGKFMLVGHQTDFNAPGPIGPNGYPSNLFAVPVSDDGTPGVRSLFATSTPVFGLNMSSDGNGFFAAWATNSRNTGAILGISIANSGIPVAPPFPIAQGTYEVGALTWDGQQYILAYDDFRTPSAVSVSAAGTVSTPQQMMSADQRPIAVASDIASNGNFSMIALDVEPAETVTTGALGAGTDVTVKFVTPDIATFDPSGSERPELVTAQGIGIVAALSPPFRALPAIATNANGSLAVWYEFRAEQAETAIVARPIGPDGAPAGFPVVVARRLGTTPEPRIATDGTNFLLVWRQGFPLRTVALRLAPSGQPLDTAPIDLLGESASFDDEEVTFDGTNYVIAFMRGVIESRGGLRSTIYVRRISPTGVLLDPAPVAVSAASTANSLPSLASQRGERSLVVWQKQSSITARFVNGSTPEGTEIVVDAVGVKPRVAWRQDNYFIAYVDTVGGRNIRLGMALVSALGTPQTVFGPTIDIADASFLSEISRPTAMPYRGGFLVLWSEGNAAAPYTQTMRAVAVTSNGTPLGPPITLGNAVAGELSPVSESPIVYARYDTDGNADVYARAITSTPGTPRRRVGN